MGPKGAKGGAKAKKRQIQNDDEEYFDDGQDWDEPIGGSKKGRKGDKSKLDLNGLEDPEIVFQDHSKTMALRKDHQNRPVWITPDARIYLEAFSPHYQGAYDFLVAIGEPVSQPKLIHTYRLTEDSLYAAVALGIDTDKIIKTLSRLCKTELPTAVATFIRNCTYTFGKAKLVLKDNQFYVESQFPEVLRELLKNPVIKDARSVEQVQESTSAGGGTATTSGGVVGSDGFLEATVQAEDRRNLQLINIDGDDDDFDDEDE